jgi:hypothetical protein
MATRKRRASRRTPASDRNGSTHASSSESGSRRLVSHPKANGSRRSARTRSGCSAAGVVADQGHVTQVEALEQLADQVGEPWR